MLPWGLPPLRGLGFDSSTFCWDHGVALDVTLSRSPCVEASTIGATINYTIQWFNRKLARMVKRKNKPYQRHKKSLEWKVMDRETKEQVAQAKEDFLEKTHRNVMESKNTGSFFKAMKMLKTKNAPK